MSKTILSLAIGGLLLALGLCAEAQQPTKAPPIGYLPAASGSSPIPPVDSFRQGLREIGPVVGEKHII